MTPRKNGTRGVQASTIADRHRQRSAAARAVRRFAVAEQEARVAIAADPYDAASYLCLVWALVDQGRAREAEEAANRALALAPTLPEASYALGLAIREGGDSLRAIDAFRSAVRVAPRNADFVSQLAVTLAQTARLELAMRTADEALALAPANASVLARAAMVYGRAQRADRAEALARAAVALDPHEPGRHALLSSILVGSGKLVQARDAAIEALAIDPNDIGAWRRLGAASWLLKREDESLAAYHEAARIAPDDTATVADLAQYLWRYGDAAGAMAACDRALASRANVAQLTSLRSAIEAAPTRHHATRTFRPGPGSMPARLLRPAG